MSDGRRETPGAFEALFGVPPDAVGQAPGRVNLLGEHTDYNGGFVLPTAIPQRTGVEVARRTGRDVVVVSEGVEPQRDRFETGHEARVGRWVDYIQGVTWAMRAEGHAVHGFVARVTSTVPVGAGLSSSAALLVALCRALRELYGLPLSDAAVARVAYRAEREFVDAPVGVMDPMASSLADPHTALFLDARTLRYERIALPATSELVVVDSGVAHQNTTGDYRTRRAECEEAARRLKVPELRDAPADWEARVAALPPPLDRRARHVITENARVLDAVAALKAGDDARMGALMTASHASMRDDFEMSVPEVDALVTSALAQKDALGARLTGGGFGGAVVALVRKGSAAHVAEAMLADAQKGGNTRARVMVPPGSSA